MTDETIARDLEHLRILSVFHYVVAGVTGLFALFPLIHLTIGLAMVTGALPIDSEAEAATARFVGWIFVLFAAGWILAGMAIAVLIWRAGLSLARRRNHTFCLVVAGVACIMMPFGTVLGVFTIVVLMRDSVKALFDTPDSIPDNAR